MFSTFAFIISCSVELRFGKYWSLRVLRWKHYFSMCFFNFYFFRLPWYLFTPCHMFRRFLPFVTKSIITIFPSLLHPSTVMLGFIPKTFPIFPPVISVNFFHHVFPISLLRLKNKKPLIFTFIYCI